MLQHEWKPDVQGRQDLHLEAGCGLARVQGDDKGPTWATDALFLMNWKVGIAVTFHRLATSWTRSTSTFANVA
jgi:hypothetical protein